jgi:hypothetical protein
MENNENISEFKSLSDSKQTFYLQIGSSILFIFLFIYTYFIDKTSSLRFSGALFVLVIVNVVSLFFRRAKSPKYKFILIGNDTIKEIEGDKEKIYKFKKIEKITPPNEFDNLETKEPNYNLLHLNSMFVIVGTDENGKELRFRPKFGILATPVFKNLKSKIPGIIIDEALAGLVAIKDRKMIFGKKVKAKNEIREAFTVSCIMAIIFVVIMILLSSK